MFKFVVKQKTLNERDARAITQSQQFKNWFGNSVIKDDNGNPKILYHGTNREFFDSFSPSVVGSLGAGIYLTSDNEMADVYSSGPKGKQQAAKFNYEALPRSIPLYVKAQKPLVLNSDEEIPEEQLEQKIKSAKQKGFDSIIFNVGTEKFVEVVVFEPTQVKSAISSGFNPKDQNIVNEKEI